MSCKIASSSQYPNQGLRLPRMSGMRAETTAARHMRERVDASLQEGTIA